MQLEEILQEYGKRKTLGQLRPDKMGVCRVLINEDLVVSFEKSLDRKGFYLYSAVGKIPPERECEICVMALRGNLFGRETGHANLGYIQKSGLLILFDYVEEATTNYLQFEQRLDHFIQYLAYWMNKIQIREAPSLEEVSLQKHVLDLQKHAKLKIFFA